MAAFMKPEIQRYRGQTCVSRDELPETAAQVWQSHAFVFINALGELEQCDPLVPANIVTSGKVFGITAYEARGDQYSTNIEPTTSDGEILMSISHSGDPLLAVTSQALVGQKFAITVVTDASGVEYWTVDINNTTDQVVQIQRIAPEFPVGEQFGPVYCKVLKSFLQYQP